MVATQDSDCLIQRCMTNSNPIYQVIFNYVVTYDNFISCTTWNNGSIRIWKCTRQSMWTEKQRDALVGHTPTPVYNLWISPSAIRLLAPHMSIMHSRKMSRPLEKLLAGLSLDRIPFIGNWLTVARITAIRRVSFCDYGQLALRWPRSDWVWIKCPPLTPLHACCHPTHWCSELAECDGCDGMQCWSHISKYINIVKNWTDTGNPNPYESWNVPSGRWWWRTCKGLVQGSTISAKHIPYFAE